MIRILFKGLKNLYSFGKPILVLKSFQNYFFAFFRIPKNVPFPPQIQIEPSGVCNLNCQMCSLRFSAKNKKSFLFKDDFERILKGLKDLQTVNFTGMGESLLNKELPKIIEMARTNKIDSQLISNGQLLNKNLIKQTTKSGLSKISISIESANPTKYEEIRKGAFFKTLEKNILDLKNEIKQSGSDLKLIFNVVLLKDFLQDKNEYIKMIDFARKNEVEEITFQFPHNIDQFELKRYFASDGQFLSEFFSKVKQYAQKNNISVSLPAYKIKKGFCYYPWVYPQITSDGELLPCCIIAQFGDYQKIKKQYSFGNVLERSFAEVWNGPKAISFREKLVSNPCSYCKSCSKYLGVL